MSRAYQQRFVDHDLPEAWGGASSSVFLAIPVSGWEDAVLSRLVAERLLARRVGMSGISPIGASW